MLPLNSLTLSSPAISSSLAPLTQIQIQGLALLPEQCLTFEDLYDNFASSYRTTQEVLQSRVPKRSSLPAWCVLLVSASLVICPEISEMFERLPRRAGQAGPLACELCHLMPAVHWDGASWICKPWRTVSYRPLIWWGCCPAASRWSSSFFSPLAEAALPPPLAFSWVSALAQQPVGPFVPAGINGFRIFCFLNNPCILAHLGVAVLTPLLRRAAQLVFCSLLERLRITES